MFALILSPVMEDVVWKIKHIKVTFVIKCLKFKIYSVKAPKSLKGQISSEKWEKQVKMSIGKYNIIQWPQSRNIIEYQYISTIRNYMEDYRNFHFFRDILLNYFISFWGTAWKWFMYALENWST